jgi:hypothetical protein
VPSAWGSRTGYDDGELGDATIEALLLEHADLDLHHVQPARVLGHVVKLHLPQDPSCLGRLEGVVERRRGVRREVVEHHTHAVGVHVVQIHQLSDEGRKVRIRAPLGDLHQPPRSVHVHAHEQVRRPVAHVLVVALAQLARLRGHRHPRLADQLDRRLVEGHHGALGVGGLGVQVEHILHSRDVLAVDLRDAPHLLAPRLELVLRQAAAHGGVAQRGVRGQAHHLSGEQLQRPTRPALGRGGARRRDQQRLLLARELSAPAGARRVVQGGRQTLLHEVPLRSVDRGRAGAHRAGDLDVRHARVGGEQELCTLDLAHLRATSRHHGLELGAFLVAQRDPVPYVHGR